MRQFALLLLVAALCGCKHVSPLVGTWEGPMVIGSLSGTGRLVFKEDGTYTATETFQARNKIQWTDYGTWKLDDANRLTTHVDDIRLITEGSGVALEKFAKSFRDNKSKMITEANAQPTDVITWQGHDHYSYQTPKGETRNRHRVQ